jgi:tetratricopeptide (TPR) repeat protein
MVKGQKISKKKLKEPDEFITVTEKVFVFVKEHAKKIVTGGIILVAFVLAFVLYQMWEGKKETEANEKVSAAAALYQRASSPYREGTPEDYKTVLDNLQEIINRYSGTQSGAFALLYRANVLLRMGSYDESIKAYETFLSKMGKEKLYRLFALEGLGYSYEGKKDYQKAVETYQKMADMGETFESGEAFLNLGRCYEKLQKNKEAIESYNAYLKIFPKSQSSNAVLRKIALLEK